MSSENPHPDHDRGPEQDPHADEEQHAGRDRRASRLRRRARTRRAVSQRVVVGGPAGADEGTGDAGAREDRATEDRAAEDRTTTHHAGDHDTGRTDGRVAGDAGEDEAAAETAPGPAADRASGAGGAEVADRPGVLRRGLAGLGAQLPRSRSGRVLAGLLVVVTAATGVLGWKAYEARAVDQAREEAQSAAQDSVANVLSYDHRRIGKDFAEARAGLTDSFGAKYAESEDVVGPPARRYEVTVKANVVESSVVQATPDRVVLLLYVNQETTSDRLDGPRVDLARVRVTMAEEEGWKVDDLDAL